MVFIDFSLERCEERALEEIDRAKNETEENGICIRNGTIDLRMATAISDLMTMANRERAWNVTIIDCKCCDQEAMKRLSEALSSRIRAIDITFDDRGNPSGSRGIRDLIAQALFQPSSFENMRTNLKELRIDCMQYQIDEIYSSMRRFFENAMVLERLEMSRCVFSANETTRFGSFSRLFRGIKHKPKEVCFGFMNAGDFGVESPLSPANEWQGLRDLTLRYSTGGLPNLYEFPNLRSLKDRGCTNDSFAVDDHGLIQLLAKPGCKLSELVITERYSPSFCGRLFRAVQGCRSLRALTVQSMHLTECKDEFLGSVTRNPALESIEFSDDTESHESTFSKIATILESTNSTIQTIEPFTFESRIRYLLFRNWAGRRILSKHPNAVPAGLWPMIFARIYGDASNRKYKLHDIVDDTFQTLCADSTYHLLRNSDVGFSFGIASINSSDIYTAKKRKR